MFERNSMCSGFFRSILMVLVLAYASNFKAYDIFHFSEDFSSQEVVSKLLKECGFLELGNTQFLRKNYADVYYYFDRFIDLIDEDEEFAKLIYEAEQQFLADANGRSRYCSAPPSYRDPRRHSRKRFSKVYFQFIKEACEILEKSGKLPDNPDIRAFFEGMHAIDDISKEMFKHILKRLEKMYPGITAKAYGAYNELTVITKIIRYEKAEDGQWGTTPHVDKSALSLILNSDDPNDENLWLCEDVENPAIVKMHKPNRVFNRRFDCSSALLIPGAECLKAGFDLKPTVHGVRPISRPYRHAVVSFLLIPDVDMSDIVTDFTDMP